MPLTMHGRVCESRCTRCDKVIPDEKIYEAGELPKSDCCQKLLRPHIVWFGEMPFFIPEIERRLGACDLFRHHRYQWQCLSGGRLSDAGEGRWSHDGLPEQGEIPQDRFVDRHLEGPATQLVPEFFR